VIHPLPASLTVPSIRRRLAAIPYEGLLVLALVLIAAFPLAGLKGVTLQGTPHLLMQVYFFVVTAAYFIWFWQHGGQTLAMKTWRFRVVDKYGNQLSVARACVRFILALGFFGPACVGLILLFFPGRISPVLSMWLFLPMIASLLWARFDTDRQFLHDRLAGTRLVSVLAPA